MRNLSPSLAILLNRLPVARRILDPLFATYYAIPVYAFYPLLIVIFGFLVLTVVDQWSEIKDKGVHFHVLWLIPAFAVLPVFYALSALGWDLTLRFLGYRIGAGRAQVAWGQPLLARYVPGSVLYVLGRMLLSERAGVPYYPKLVLAAPLTPATGRRFLVAPGLDEVAGDGETGQERAERHEIGIGGDCAARRDRRAKRAERTFRYELGLRDSSYIQFVGRDKIEILRAPKGVGMSALSQ